MNGHLRNLRNFSDSKLFTYTVLHTVAHTRYTIHTIFPVFKSFMCTNVVHNIQQIYNYQHLLLCRLQLANYLAMQLLQNYDLCKILKSEPRKFMNSKHGRSAEIVTQMPDLSHVATIIIVKSLAVKHFGEQGLQEVWQKKLAN